MSTELLEAHGLFVTRYAGPVSQGEDRVRFQFTIPGEYMSVDRAELHDLLEQLNDALAREAQGAVSVRDKPTDEVVMPPVGTRIEVGPDDEVIDFGDGTFAVRHPDHPGVWIQCYEAE